MPELDQSMSLEAMKMIVTDDTDVACDVWLVKWRQRLMSQRICDARKFVLCLMS